MLTDVRITDRRVRLFGPRHAVEATSPREGVVRVRLVPGKTLVHPDLPNKRSFAVFESAPRSIGVSREGDEVQVAIDEATLTLSLDGRFTLRDRDGRALATCLSWEGETRDAFPVPHHRTRLAMRAPKGEAYLGFGEKIGPIDKRGMRFTFWNTDAFPPQTTTDPLYASIPFFVGLKDDGLAWGLFLDEPWRSEVDVARSDPRRLTWTSTGPELDVYLIAGPSIGDVIRRYAHLTGLPAMPPLWSLGAHQSRWGYESAEEVRSVVRAARVAKFPIDAIHLDIDHLDGHRPLTWDRSRFPDPTALVRELAKEGVRVVTIVDPGLKLDDRYPAYATAREQGFLVQNSRGEPLVGEVWPHPAVFPDLTREEVQRWWGELHAPHARIGVAGVWNDMNEPSCFSLVNVRGLPTPDGGRGEGHGHVEGRTLPDDARHGDRRHLEVHNAYASGMARAAYEGLTRANPERRPFVLTRAGYAGIQRYAAMWTGDFGSDWTHLEASIAMLIGMGVSGLPFVGADVPGFVGDADGELLARWAQLATFYPFMRDHAAKGTAPKEPWRFDRPWRTIAREAWQRRYRLLPTLYSLAHEAALTGAPIFRPVAWIDPSDREALAQNDAFLFGDALLVAPVVRPKQSKRLVYLPRGAWARMTNLEPSGAIDEGKSHVVADAPIESTPIWLARGRGIATTEPTQYTASARWRSLTWTIHAGDQTIAKVYEDAGDGAGAHRTTTLRGSRAGDRWILTRETSGELTVVRDKEIVRVLGLRATKVEGGLGYRAIDGGVEIDVAAEWSQLVVT